jgi:myo-inositol catabolism protein IolC
MALGHAGRLYVLAFDHRGSFRSGMFGIRGEPTRDEAARIADAKELVYEGFERALALGAPGDAAGVLVDEESGARVARRAKASGAILAIPVERSGQDEFDFEYGDDFGRHIEEFDPDFAKVLVRFNPEGDADLIGRQSGRLRRLSDWLRGRDRRLMFELLVPAEPHQLERAAGDPRRYDEEIRPGLMVRAVRALQDAGVEPDVWKIEGLSAREDCSRVADQARAGGRDGVVCVVLGRGADRERVVEWLRQGSGVAGYAGFAIGRTIWWEPVAGYVAGELTRDVVAGRIAANYLDMIEAYEAAGG